jgi:hypothetical protein
MRIGVSSWTTTEGDIDQSLAAIVRIAGAICFNPHSPDTFAKTMRMNGDFCYNGYVVLRSLRGAKVTNPAGETESGICDLLSTAEL